MQCQEEGVWAAGRGSGRRWEQSLITQTTPREELLLRAVGIFCMVSGITRGTRRMGYMERVELGQLLGNGVPVTLDSGVKLELGGSLLML